MAQPTAAGIDYSRRAFQDIGAFALHWLKLLQSLVTVLALGLIVTALFVTYNCPCDSTRLAPQ
jgi:hypothetical protein